ncbi:ATP synthase F1 subunit epsilon [Candidatus Peribacteria bacterium RIFCSPLOWO2_12_FULL_55_15]|nr:MAG: ATP synthase F1 subunit epsilon [Candidatus Peribacteria bacterium RIFCSPHIGHO2_01_FULL_54_22]OGJ63104.1 MAG: ATP synthase F1 subunit epsilon [Candidatus Peribacteria bacterium RIFCSPHIGHO2_02_FULL_55_24]OGJ64043.1 MAG: ATP synthase F1 subunit epsilon [Candidatus Peribacteria bacterium RIFCSPHIGHO2_12_FULL_54_10]OGJ68978.1 MAG: ATP synthase F1 subunit epsilon [Candidatus Peribacteria bacterium RIFCSPLOWO2_01_FULL_54_110]OGJ70166.1 MAG: ATP synthase F1 subunit epsilon [Candidatus Peribac
MLSLELITPDRVVFEGDVDAVSLPTPLGEITILPHHIPLLSILSPGSILLRQKEEEHLFAVSRGVIEVDGTHVRVLADTADRATELEEEAVRQAKEKAEQLLKEKRADAEEFAEAAAMLDRELARLKVVRRHRSSRGSPGSTRLPD